MKPIIAITTPFSEETNLQSVNNAYAKAVYESGGIPLFIGYTQIEIIPNLIDILDGIIFSGGSDIDPLIFGEEPIKTGGKISPTRDLFEIQLCKTALNNDIPILGICRGIQVINVAAGGTVIQDIYSYCKSMLKHSQQAPKWYGTHTVTIAENSILNKIVSEKNIVVNSFHHQAVGSLGKEFIPCAKSSDNVIEAIEHTKNKFALGIQWHPECMFEKHDLQLNIFKALINSAKK